MKANKNGIFNTPGNKASGLMALASLALAQNFRDRVNNGVFIMSPPVEPTVNDLVLGDGEEAGLAALAEKRTAYEKALKTFNETASSKGVVKNDDGTLTVPEVLPRQGNGYDAYANAGGFMRKDVPYNFGPQALARFIVISLDALHVKAAGTDDEAKEAQQVLEVVRAFDSHAAEQVAERNALAAEALAAKTKQENYEKAKLLAAEQGITPEAFEAFWNNGVKPVPVASVEVDDNNEDNEVDGSESEVAELV